MEASENYRDVFDNRIGFGRRPALVVVDFVKGYVTPGSPLFAEGVVRAVAETPPLIAAARAAQIPVIFTEVKYTAPHFLDGGIWLKKVPSLQALTAGSLHAEFCDEIAPLPGEIVLTKQYASAFFGTSLASILVAAEADTLLIAGCSTSGCIRATAVDAMQHGYRTIVVRECVGDRHPAPHEANLFDINAKYGDVVNRAEAINYLERLVRS